MTKKQKKLLKKLQAEHGAKFDQICELVRKRLGYRKLSKLSDEERRQVVEEAEELTENWDRAVVEDRELQAKTKLQKLLAEHHEIGERLLTLHQSAACETPGGSTMTKGRTLNDDDRDGLESALVGDRGGAATGVAGGLWRERAPGADERRRRLYASHGR